MNSLGVHPFAVALELHLAPPRGLGPPVSGLGELGAARGARGSRKKTHLLGCLSNQTGYRSMEQKVTVKLDPFGSGSKRSKRSFCCYMDREVLKA